MSGERILNALSLSCLMGRMCRSNVVWLWGFFRCQSGVALDERGSVTGEDSDNPNERMLGHGIHRGDPCTHPLCTIPRRDLRIAQFRVNVDSMGGPACRFDLVHGPVSRASTSACVRRTSRARRGLEAETQQRFFGFVEPDECRGLRPHIVRYLSSHTDNQPFTPCLCSAILNCKTVLYQTTWIEPGESKRAAGIPNCATP